MTFKTNNISIIDIVNAVFLTVIIVFFIFSFPASPYSFRPLAVLSINLILILFAIAFRGKKNKNAVVRAVVTFYPLLWLFIIFESFFMILPYFNPERYDELLAGIDYSLFGVHPAVWIERFVRPWLTDIMYLLYLFYFPMPLFILGYLFKNKRYVDLDKSVFIYLIVYYTAYTGYFIVPAAGPRFYEPLANLQTLELNGVIFAVPVRNLINFLEPNKLDAFPSLHSAISLTTLLLMFKFNRKMFWWFLPVVTGIFISLVYCRYHYVVDIIAGVILSVACFYAGNVFYDKFAKGKTATFIKPL